MSQSRFAAFAGPYRWVAAIALLGVMLSVATYQFSLRHDEQRQLEQFDDQAHDHALRLQSSLDQVLAVLTTTQGLFNASDTVSRKEFGMMVAPALAHHPEIVAINWAPRIAAYRRSAFEQALREEGIGNLGIYDVLADARLAHRAEPRDEYFPVMFSEPLNRNRSAIGIDPYSRPQNRAAMQAAMSSGKQWSTPPFPLIQDPQGPLAVAIYQPVFHLDRPLATPEERKTALRGFVILLLQPGLTMEAALIKPSSLGIDTRLLDAGPQPVLIKHLPSRLAGNRVAPNEHLHGEYPLQLPGRQWTLRMTATQGFRQQARSLEPLTLLVSGLLLSGLLSLLLWAQARQTREEQRLHAELQASEQRLRQTFEINTAIKLIIDPADGRIVDANSAACDYYGHPRAKLLGMHIADINIMSRQAIELEMQQARDERRLYFNFQHRLANGTVRDVEVYSGPIETAQGRLLYSIIHDVTERKRTEQALQESEDRFHQLADNLESVFWICSPDWQQIIYISPAYEHIWGRSHADLYQNGMDWFEAVIEEDRATVRTKLPSPQQLWHSFHFPPFRILRPDGGIRWIAARAYPVHDRKGHLIRIAGIAEDISERMTYQQHLEELAHFDTLTHLPNRRLLADRMQLAMAHSRRSNHLLGICMLDLDGFKPVNDQYGHEVGDQLLIEVSQRLLDCVRGDDTVARLGGDEFVLLLSGLNSAGELEEALRRVLQRLSAAYMLTEQPIIVSASIGVTLYPSDNGDADTLLRHADHAMYLAKEAGKNRFILFNPTLIERERDNRAVLDLIRSAVAKNQLRLFYQPIVDCHRGRVVGMEALLRWQHPILGLMAPAEFLPLVEGDEDLARNVGTWVLEQAIWQADQWRQAGLDIPVSINVFVQQLRDNEFPQLLLSLLDAYPDLPPGRICIEILENTALDDFASVTRLIQLSASHGVRFALDDFGTGFSSLTYLRRLPVNTLKIDQSFVRDMLHDPDDLTIVEGVIGLSTAFRHQVIAEGVETAEHALMLMEMGCYQVQGYGIARPMPGEDTLAWVENFQPDPRWLDLSAQRLSRDDFQLVLAEVNHRQWLTALQNWSRQDPEHRSPAPPLNGHQCNFGRWYYSDGFNRYGHLAEYRNVEALHDRVHQLAQEMVHHAEIGETSSSRDSEASLLQAAAAFQIELAEIRKVVKFVDAGQ
jgi:diguanylate cyclase (GGDEF)-like protein/PAS domain S-box-containing protein